VVENKTKTYIENHPQLAPSPLKTTTNNEQTAAALQRARVASSLVR
jgi:hypothetical protein